MKNLSRWMKSSLIFIAFIALSIPSISYGTDNTTIDAAYPNLVSGALMQATVGDLPDGLVLRSKGLEISAQDIEKEIQKLSKEIKPQMEKNRLFLLDQVATQRLLALLALNDVETTQTEEVETRMIQAYFENLTKDTSVSEKELAEFYEKNKDMCGGASFEKIASELRAYVLQQKKQDAVRSHIQNIGKTRPISVSGKWVKEQAALATDNPVDKARSSGKPSMVDFGANGCRPCDMLAPILEILEKKYEGKINIIFVHVNKEHILAARFGIQSIPVQVFFDKTGRELFRHTGFIPQEDIENKFAELGMK